jgi:hypothetical protein
LKLKYISIFRPANFSIGRAKVYQGPVCHSRADFGQPKHSGLGNEITVWDLPNPILMTPISTESSECLPLAAREVAVVFCQVLMPAETY